MDASPEVVAGVLREMKAAGKAVIGMKILGQGDLRHRMDVSSKGLTNFLQRKKARQKKCRALLQSPITG